MKDEVTSIADDLHENSKKNAHFIRENSFDIIAVVIVICMSAISLGALKLKDISFWGVIDILLEAVPFYFTAQLLSQTYYKKGVTFGKKDTGFLDSARRYSIIVDDLTGKQLDRLHDFCQEYNANVKRRIQESYLREGSISWELFTKSHDGKKPLCQWKDENLIKHYGEEVGKLIIKAKNVRIKGLHANILLGSFASADTTDLGPNEAELAKRQSKKYLITNAVSVFIIALIGVKDIRDWGWIGAFLMVFKIGYIFCRSYMKYYDGFDDITVRLKNHVSRKADVLKEFLYWDENKSKAVSVEVHNPD